MGDSPGRQSEESVTIRDPHWIDNYSLILFSVVVFFLSRGPLVLSTPHRWHWKKLVAPVVHVSSVETSNSAVVGPHLLSRGALVLLRRLQKGNSLTRNQTRHLISHTKELLSTTEKASNVPHLNMASGSQWLRHGKLNPLDTNAHLSKYWCTRSHNASMISWIPQKCPSSSNRILPPRVSIFRAVGNFSHF